MTSNARNHALFQTYPQTGTETISTGEVPIPYHVYRGRCLLIGGTINLNAAQTLLKDEAVFPLETAAGKALLGIWICDFQDASLGPHQELQFSFFVSREPAEKVLDHPFAALQALALDPNVAMLAHAIWNDSRDSVAYNREILGLNANLMTGTIAAETNPARLGFQLASSNEGDPLLHGEVKIAPRTSLRASWSLLRLFGLSAMRTFVAQPWLTARVINPKGTQLPFNATALAFTKNDQEILQYWDSDTDILEISISPYQTLNFQPGFAEHMLGFKFVYLHPDQTAYIPE